MEMKSIKPMKLSAQWLKQNCLAYKRWFIFTAVILSVITIVVPMLFEHEKTYFVIPGVFALFLISFVMMLSQLNFLHNSKAFAYVASKALPLKSRIYGIIVTQAIFCGVFILFLYVIGYISGTDLFENGRLGLTDYNMIFTIVFAWTLILLLLVPLSALLSGTTISAAISTLFNFSIPVSIFGVIYFVINVANEATVGFNVGEIMSELVMRFYRIDYIYHVDSPWYVMIILLPVTLGIIFTLLNWAIKNRKHERIGQSFVFKGYKVFILFLLSLLAPLGLTLLLTESSFIAQWISVLILGSITLYILLAILDKNLKLSKKAYQLIGAYLVGVSLCIGIAIWGLNTYMNQIPNLDEVEAVILSRFTSVSDFKGNFRSIYGLKSTDNDGDYPIYRTEEGKKKVHMLHQIIIEQPETISFTNDPEQEWYYLENGMNFNLIYFMKDGSRKIYPFSIEASQVSNEGAETVYDVWASDMLKDETFLSSASSILFGNGLDHTLGAELYISKGVVQIDQKELKKLIDLIRSDVEIQYDRSWFWKLYTSNEGFMNLVYSDEEEVYEYNLSIRTFRKNNDHHFNLTVLKRQKALIEYLESFTIK